MANSPIWMRERGLGNLEPLSPYAHDETRNTFKLGYLGQRGGSNGLGRLPALAESFGGGITVLTDSTDPNVLAAIEAFRRQMENTYPDENLLHTLVCVPTFAPRTCLRRPSGAIRMHNKTLSLLVSKRFVDYTTECSYHISSSLSLEKFEVDPIVETILTLSRPTSSNYYGQQIHIGSEFPSKIALGPYSEVYAPDSNCPWHTMDSYAPFWYGRDRYGDGTPNGMVYVPGDRNDSYFYVICARQPLADDSGFRDGNGQGVLFVHRTHADVPDEEWMLSHINRYSVGMDPEELLEEMLYGTKLHGSYTDNEGHFRALCWHDFSHRYVLSPVNFQSRWHNAEYYKSSWITHYDQYGSKSVYGEIMGKVQSSFERWVNIRQMLHFPNRPEISLHVKVEGNRWDRMTIDEQMQARHTIRVSDLSGAGGIYEIFDLENGTILASGSASPNGSVELSFCPGQFEEFRKSKRKTFGFSATNSFIIGNPEELAEMRRTPFPAAEEGTFNYQEITDQIYL
ncbi:MAG: hypothetical protein IJV69_02295 [Kiritimatiellae bacterium]|nr:hypothetical protein [Kiritimatiellia bacterium]